MPLHRHHCISNVSCKQEAKCHQMCVNTAGERGCDTHFLILLLSLLTRLEAIQVVLLPHQITLNLNYKITSICNCIRGRLCKQAFDCCKMRIKRKLNKFYLYSVIRICRSKIINRYQIPLYIWEIYFFPTLLH